MQPPIQEKQRIIRLVEELKGYIEPGYLEKLKTQQIREKTANRMLEIKEELVAFRRKYPDA